jgi:DNA (cytosine-5)-methyltransferase 1
MRYLSVCSGIEAATVAWHPFGWEPAAFSDIEAFPRAVLRHHYQHVPLHGRDRLPREKFEDYADEAGFQTIKGNEYGPIDLLVGGTPCQDFSIAGLRAGLDGGRGNLSLEFLKLLGRTRARWVVWENVPGVLSSNGGRDFGSILGGLVELGYGFAYRVLDAQYVRVDGFGRAVPQRRRRVFVVGHFGDWRRAAAVLFERESLRGDIAPSRNPRAGIATGFEAGPSKCDFTTVAPTLRSMHGKKDNGGGHLAVIQAIAESQTGHVSEASVTQALGCTGGKVGQGYQAVRNGKSVRRLTPRECERLQGFPDDYTQIPYRGRDAEQCPDGPRYKALGNSMAVNCMRWIGKRITAVDALTTIHQAAE